MLCLFIYVQAYKALEQLHQVDLNERKELFILSYLELDRENKNKSVKSPVSIDTCVLCIQIKSYC